MTDPLTTDDRPPTTQQARIEHRESPPPASCLLIGDCRPATADCRLPI